MNERIIAQILFLSIFSAFIISCSAASFSLTMFKSNQNAACLDGTPYGVYYQSGSGNGKNKFLIFFEGGGACLGTTQLQFFTQCYERSKTDLGSSKTWSLLKSGKGIYSDDQKSNPYFYNWNKLYVPYCDGTLHQGYIPGHIPFSGQDLHFRGYFNTIQAFSYLAQNKGLLAAQEVLLTGSSAGGLAAFAWSNYLRSALPKTTKQWTAPDSGFFIDYSDSLDNGTFIQTLKILAQTSVPNPSFFQPAGCPYANDSNNSYKCLLPFYTSPLQSVPMFIIESEYDSFQVLVGAAEQCVYGKDQPLSMQNCTLQQQAQINDFRLTLMSNISAVLKQHPGWGAWMPACIQHVFLESDETFNSDMFQVPMMSSYTANLGLYQWMYNIYNGNNYMYIDQVLWPNNSPCCGNTSSSIFSFNSSAVLE